MSRFRPALRPALPLGALLGVLLGCASAGPARPPAPDVAAAREADGEGLYLNLVAELLEDARPHAALAYLDAMPEERAGEPRARLLRAEVLRRLSRFDEADALYEALGQSDLAAQAWRGRGLIEAARGELEGALAWLVRARERLPTDARIRNDLGYALLLRGELERAGAELATAVELGETRRAPRNLVLLLFVKGEPASAEEVARRHLGSESLAPIRARAEELRSRLGVEMGTGGGA